MFEAALTVVESRAFVVHSAAIWSDDERYAFIDYIARNPAAGGRGKRGGGARVIYYHHSLAVPLFLLTVYTKGVQEDLSPRQKADMRDLVKTLAEAYGRRKNR